MAPIFYKNAQKPQVGASFNSVAASSHGLQIDVLSFRFFKKNFQRKINKQNGRLRPAYFPSSHFGKDVFLKEESVFVLKTVSSFLLRFFQL